ncbi:MAG: type II toxin-antitoxin system Phd/YefM family antitoxin [Verrucomicrobiota bacterium]
MITRKKEQAVVVISLKDHGALQETAYFLRTPANANRLIASIEAAEKGDRIGSLGAGNPVNPPIK